MYIGKSLRTASVQAISVMSIVLTFRTMTNGIIVYLTVSFGLIFASATVSAHSLPQCSPFCVCDFWYGLWRASCTGRHLYSIHAGAPSVTRALDLSDNVISILNSFELANAELTKLKYLNLSTNAISEIGLNAFDGLVELTVLDLSRNRLYYILDHLFDGNKNLRILKLSRNNFNSHVPKLQSSSITELDLDSCQISHLPADTFEGLVHVRRLDLSDNMMIQMSSTVVQALHFLKKISLEGNPWTCNKIMQDLQLYLTHRSVEFDQACGKRTSPQKFQKMIIFPITKPRNYQLPTITNTPAQGIKPTNNNDASNTSVTKNVSACVQKTNDTMPVNSVYWILCVGFISGLSSGLVISYIWLSVKCSCYRVYGHRGPLNDASQRLSLLDSHLHGRAHSNENFTESCPGTPPPPYREVMLRPNLYRCPSIVSYLNNNAAGYRGMRT